MSDISAHLETGVILMAAVDTVSVAQLMEVRHILDVSSSGVAAHRRTDAQLDSLRESIYDPQAAQGQATYVENQDFHLGMLGAADNPLLEVVTVPVFRVLSSRFTRDGASDEFWQRVDHDHRGLLESIESGDLIGTMDAMRRHLDYLTDAYMRMDRLRRN